jgi:sugar (pentulose or hexulose) kinase
VSSNLLTLDMGTSSLHCMVTDACATPLASVSTPMTYSTPAGASELTLEFQPQGVMDAMGKLVAQALGNARLSGSSVKAIGITGQRQGMVFLGRGGGEVMASPNLDLRAVFQGAALDEELENGVYRITGHFPTMLLAPARLRWLQENKPQDYEDLDYLLTVPGWVAYRLTGNRVCERSLAAAAGLLEVSSQSRPPEIMDKLGVPPELLPPLTRAGDVLGGLAPALAQEWGLEPGIPVTLAGADTQCGLLGMGLVRDGDIGVVAGWSCALQVLTPTPCYDDGMSTWVGCSLHENLWVSEANLGDSGNAQAWLKDTIFGQGVSWEEAQQAANQAPSGSGEILCYLGQGPQSAPKARLKRGGILFPTPLSYRRPDPGQALRAFWEGLAFSLKANLDQLHRVTGLGNGAIHLGGGMARSTTFSAILADVVGRVVHLSPEAQVSGHGAALAASVAAGHHDSLESAVQTLSAKKKRLEPNGANSLEYQEHYQQWQTIYNRLQDDSLGG